MLHISAILRLSFRVKLKTLFVIEDGEPELCSGWNPFLVHPEPWAPLAGLHPKSETTLVL